MFHSEEDVGDELIPVKFTHVEVESLTKNESFKKYIYRLKKGGYAERYCLTHKMRDKFRGTDGMLDWLEWVVEPDLAMKMSSDENALHIY